MKTMPNLFVRKVILFLFVLSLLPGCGPAGVRERATPAASDVAAEAGETQGSAAQPSADTGEADEGTARFVDESVEDLSEDLPALGSVTFTVDAAHQVSGEFAPGGAGLKLSLTDAVGLTWTLTLPPSALTLPETITMTALNEVQSANIPGSQVGGVLLEPDGLLLLEPGTLAVTEGGLKGKALFLGGSHDGTRMDLALPAEAKAGSAAEIGHFSTYTVIHSEDPEVGALREQAVKHYNELAKQGRELLKDKDIDVPRPPSIPVRCPEDEDDAKERQENIQKFVEKFRKPEYTLLDKMLAARLVLEMLGVDQDYTLELRLLERSIKKVRLLIKEYGNQAENLAPISTVGLMVVRSIALIGPSDHAGSQALFLEMSRMYERAIDELLKELREEHEYRNLDAIFHTTRRMIMLDPSQSDKLTEVIERVEAATHFELELTFNLKIAGNQNYEFQGTVPVRFDFKELGNMSMLHGMGSGELVSYKNTAEPSITLSAPNFNFEVLISDFDPCKGTANLTIDRFAPDLEKYKINEELMPRLPVVHNCWKATYEKYLGSHPNVGEVYIFPVKLRNGEARAVEEEIEETAPKSQGKVTGVFKVKLTHEPAGK